MKKVALKYEKVKYELENNVAFRERENKDFYLGYLICKELGVKNVDPKITAAICKEYGTYDRLWRKNLSDDPKLQGTDYKLKTKLEKEVKSDLGYKV